MRQTTSFAITALSVLSAALAHSQEDRSPLGIQGRFDHGYGLVVERVRRGSPAGRIGLEPGDVVRAIDGRWLRTEADYRRQLRSLSADGQRVARSSVQLIIRDVRTGRLLRRPVQIR